ncbi:MAG: hypothetical protein FWE14_09355 [Lachnospiraceae bacterium]|nr:hypothetical protein [Lachnospiraceae bacterium]
MKEKAIYKMIVIMPGGIKCDLLIYEDRFKIKPNFFLFNVTAPNFSKTIYFSDLSNIHLKKSDSTPGYFLISGKGPDFRLQFNEKYNCIAEQASIFMNEKCTYNKI